MAEGYEPRPNSNVYELVTGTTSDVSVAEMKTALSNAVAQMQQNEKKYVFFNCVFGPFGGLAGLYGTLIKWSDSLWICNITSLTGQYAILQRSGGTYTVYTYSNTSTPL